jgi:proteic killer suppression protein
LQSIGQCDIREREAGLKILFADQQLALIETDQAGCTQLPVGVIKSARRKLVVLRAAVDDRSLGNWKSLNYEKLKGNRSGQHSIRLNDQYRFYFRIDKETQPWTITILTLEDGHI